jgi:geranylgeranyl diphosphate synthase type II
MNFAEQMQADKALVEEFLRGVFQGSTPHADLYDAMNYSLLAGGKRLRPILTLETCRMCGGDPAAALPFACALEMIHTYSLIHDDLPCMDDDDLRRGKPTNHKVYGEATAVLAGDGLLTAAFETALAGRDRVAPDRALAALECMANAAGAAGMVGGQALDMAGEGRALTLSDVEELQRLKTGALISAAAQMGCILAGGSEDRRRAVRSYAEKLGLAFQVQDDILDVTGDEKALGKSVGSDAKAGKATFVTLKGVEECRRMVEQLTEEATEALSIFDDPEFLTQLALHLVGRTN